jgi:hypothetical protein
LSREFTALNLLPSIATLAFANSPILRHKATNGAHTRVVIFLVLDTDQPLP